MPSCMVDIFDLIIIDVKCFYSLFKKYPRSIYKMANQIIKRLSPTIRRMDFGVEWALAEGGKALFV